MKHLFLPLLLCASLNVFAQEKSGSELKGDKYYFVYSFDKAIDKYSHTKQLSADGERKLAASYSFIHQDTQSEITYSKLVSRKDGVLPEDYYNYAMILRSDGKKEESDKWMDKFAAMQPGDLRAISYTAHKGYYADLSAEGGKYKVAPQPMNTDAEDFASCYYKNQVVFSSSSEQMKMIKRTSNWNGKPYQDMYVSDMNAGEMKDPANFSKQLNSKLHDGPASFNKAGTYMAFTRNNNHDRTSDKIVELQIWFSTYTDGKWSKEEPFTLNSQEYSVGHPCLSADGKSMYFASDMPGGFGGADLYSTTKNEKGEWSKAINLGNKINTEGDELFPFYQEENEVLFFSSNGHYGLGGQDIFYCSVNGPEQDRVINAGYPLNTTSDDFALIVDEDMHKGYFSSNRAGGKGGDDIYSVELLLELGRKIKGIAMDNSGNPLAGTFIELLNDKDGVIDTLTTKTDGSFTFFAEGNKNYKLIGKKIKYTQGEKLLNTLGKEHTVKADVVLIKKEEVIDQQIVPGVDLANVLDLRSIYFDLNQYTIRPDAEKELDEIVRIMNKYPDMVLRLSAYTDSRASKQYNQILSDKRENASAEYIKKRITRPERISGKGYGETNLVNNCSGEGDVISTCTEEEHQKNRRTEFIVVKK
jgi:outer membrane protein OmpA-like peptidoglycan-associated protein